MINNTEKNYYIFERELIDKHINPCGFKGQIYPLDFETNYRGKDNTDGSPLAQRIYSNQRFDKECIQNAIHRDMMREYNDGYAYERVKK